MPLLPYYSVIKYSEFLLKFHSYLKRSILGLNENVAVILACLLPPNFNFQMTPTLMRRLLPEILKPSNQKNDQYSSTVCLAQAHTYNVLIVIGPQYISVRLLRYKNALQILYHQQETTMRWLTWADCNYSVVDVLPTKASRTIRNTWNWKD